MITNSELPPLSPLPLTPEAESWLNRLGPVLDDLQSDAEYRAAVRVLSKLFDGPELDPGSEEGPRFLYLAERVERYERLHYPISEEASKC